MAKKKIEEERIKESDTIKQETKDKPSEDDKTKPIFVQPSPERRAIIDKFKDTGLTISSIIEEAIQMYDNYYSMPPEILAIIEKYKEEYGNEVKVIMEALKCFEACKNPQKSESEIEDELFVRAKTERDMMLIGKYTFKQLIEAAEHPGSSLDKPQTKNNALDVILWYMKKPITACNLEEIIHAVQKLWVMTNFFKRVEVNKQEGDTYYLTLIHGEDEQYSRYWLGYFRVLFEYLNSSPDVPFKCALEGQAFLQTLSITIKELFEKE